MPVMLRDWDLCCGLQTLTKSVSPAVCFKATDESHPISSATAVAATNVQSSSFQASSLSIGFMEKDPGNKFFCLICQIHLKIGGHSQEEIILGFMSLCLSFILGNKKLGGNFYGGPVLSLSPSIMWRVSLFNPNFL
ncbi:uncharacterized protein DS421_15g505660 [Arachis hypogaea]|nr:uncharacterized protein DS421_15g505660 [Arachis hypogaea]